MDPSVLHSILYRGTIYLDEMAKRRERLTDREYRALAEFRRLLRSFLAFSEKAAADEGLEPAQYQLLLAIKGAALRRDEAPTIGSLAEELGLRHHSAVGLVDRVASNGLARRRRSAADRRQVLVVLTARGERTLERLALLHHQELQQTGPGLIVSLRAALAGASRRRAAPVQDTWTPGHTRLDTHT